MGVITFMEKSLNRRSLPPVRAKWRTEIHQKKTSHRSTLLIGYAVRPVFNRSLISIRSLTSAGVSGGLSAVPALASSLRFILLMALTTRKRTQAMITKLIAIVKKFPQASTAPWVLLGRALLP